MSFRFLIVLGCLASSAFAEESTTVLELFLWTYCVSCHDENEQKGDRRFDILPSAIDSTNTLADYQDILDQLNLSEMPPRKAEKHPTDEERLQVIASLTDMIGDYHETRAGDRPQTVLRRLNAREYRNTLRDLLHLDMRMFDPTTSFPKDRTVHQLDNVGSVLVTSGYLLSRYLDASEQAIDKALLAPEKPSVQKWTFTDNFTQQSEIDRVHKQTSKFEWLTLYEVARSEKHEGAYAGIADFAEGVPADGFYKIRFEAEALNRIHPYDAEYLGMDPEEPFRLGIVPGDREAGQLYMPQTIEPLLAEIELADDRHWYETHVWLDEGFTPRFTFRNGPLDARKLFFMLPKRYPERYPKEAQQGIVAGRRVTIEQGKLPQIRIHEVEIVGPYYQEWPTPSQKALLGDDAEKILESGALPDVRALLREFLTRAYRRSASDDDIDRIVAVIETREKEGRTPLEAYGDGLKAALCSPQFLYLEEGDALSSHALASRLSYFLWSSMPDETLLSLAAHDQLRDPEVLAAEVLRLLADPKSDAFLDGFLDSWLNLRTLGSAPPDRGKFPNYYQYDLETAMREETRRFAQHLLEENLDIALFLNSDFTFVNKPLAQLYGIEPPAKPGFHKRTLPNTYRGGLFGQASVLTATANGIDTSPVVRGIWVLENILGDPPSPPPPDIDPLEPDIRGATTIRDQLEKHRNVATCYDCHREIDPLGFALENFGPIGNWRGEYENKAGVDASGELPSGETFEDIRGLKKLLLEKRPQFGRALTEKLLAYAIGRELTVHDRPQIDALSDSAEGFRDLIVAVVQSPTFCSNEAPDLASAAKQ